MILFLRGLKITDVEINNLDNEINLISYFN